MNKLQMRLCGDLALRTVCAPADDVAPEILDEMIGMMEAQRGVGLAAPQVGIPKRFLVMCDPDSKQVYKMINPVIESASDELCKMEEGCLSVVDGTDTPIFADVTRPESVTVCWSDENGAACRADFDGYIGRIVQHEIDHLDGRLFIDYLSPVKREQVMRKVKKKK